MLLLHKRYHQNLDKCQITNVTIAFTCFVLKFLLTSYTEAEMSE